jgi:hypothetical protein
MRAALFNLQLTAGNKCAVKNWMQLSSAQPIFAGGLDQQPI